MAVQQGALLLRRQLAGPTFLIHPSYSFIGLVRISLVENTDLVLILCANMMCYVNTRSEST